MDPGTMALLASVAGPAIQGIFGGGGSDSHMQVPTKSRGQKKQLNTALQQWQQLAGGGYENAIGLLQGMLDPDSDVYKGFAQPYLDQFNQQTIPGIAERFAGMNAQGGALESSGFGQALGAAGGNLQNTLAQLQQSLRMQAAQGILGQYNQGFGQTQAQEPFAYQQRSPSFGQSALAGASQGMSNYGANYFANRPVGGGDQGRGYQQQSPLTGMYDYGFRSGAMT